MNYMILAFSVIALVIANYVQKDFSGTVGTRNAIPFLFGAVWMGLNSLLYFIYCTVTGGLSFSAQTICIGIVAGVSFTFAAFTGMVSFRKGPLSLTCLIIAFALIIPIIFSIIVQKEAPTVLQFMGLLLILVVFIVINYSKNKEEKKANLPWFVFTLICALFNGIIMVCVKLHQMYLPKQEQFQYFAIVYLVGGLLSLVGYLIFTRREDEVFGKYVYTIKSFYVPCVLAGVTIAAGNLFMALIAAVIPSIILFPTNQGGVLIGVTIISAFVLKEKISLKNIIAISIGLVAIVVLNI